MDISGYGYRWDNISWVNMVCIYIYGSTLITISGRNWYRGSQPTIAAMAIAVSRHRLGRPECPARQRPRGRNLGHAIGPSRAVPQWEVASHWDDPNKGSRHQNHWLLLLK